MGRSLRKESSESDQPRISQVWHSHDCGFNSALSDRSAGSRILENSVVVVYGGVGFRRVCGYYRRDACPHSLTLAVTRSLVSLFVVGDSSGACTGTYMCMD